MQGAKVEVLPVSYAVKLKWWFLSFRPKTLTAAFVPIFVGTFLAVENMEQIDWSLALFALLSAFCVQIGTNLLNDSMDVSKGADNSSRLGPMRGAQMGILSTREVFWGAMVFYALTFLFGVPLINHIGFSMALVIIASIGCSCLYSLGPYALSYTGFGEPFIILFFGIIGTTAAWYLQHPVVLADAVLAGLQIGMLATVMHAINNLRDYEQDKNAKRKTMVVRFGIIFARLEITLLLIFPFMLNLIWFGVGFPFMTLLPMIALPIALNVVQRVWKTPPGLIYNRFLGEAALVHLLFGIFLIIGRFI